MSSLGAWPSVPAAGGFGPASYVDGQSAAVAVVTAQLAGAELRILTAGAIVPLVTWRLSDLTVEAGDERLVVRCHTAPDAELALADDAARGLAARLAELGVSRAGARFASTGGRGRRWRLVVVYGAAIATLVTAIYLALPGLARAIARRIPLETEAAALGDPIAARLLGDVCRTPESDAVLADLRRRLDPAGDARAVEIVNLAIVNAFTVPGGRIYLTRELIEEARSLDEIAGVLAHELEHVSQRHIMAYVVRSSVLSLGWAVTVGDFSGLMVVDPSTAFQIFNLRFSRADEASADAGAIRRLRAAKIPASGIVAFFERLRAKTDGGPEWLQTHPLSERRIRRFREADGAPASAGATAAAADALRRLRGACAGRAGKRTVWDALRGKDGAPGSPPGPGSRGE